jgi:hypothetical protein
MFSAILVLFVIALFWLHSRKDERGCGEAKEHPGMDTT